MRWFAERYLIKAALRTREGGKRARHQRKPRAAGIGECDGCERVEDVVMAGDAELDVAERLMSAITVKADEPLRSRTSDVV